MPSSKDFFLQDEIAERISPSTFWIFLLGFLAVVVLVFSGLIPNEGARAGIEFAALVFGFIMGLYWGSVMTARFNLERERGVKK